MISFAVFTALGAVFASVVTVAATGGTGGTGGTGDDGVAALIAGVSFVIYVGGLILASLRQIARLFAYWKGAVIRHDFVFDGPRHGIWRRDTLDGALHNHWFPMWIEHVPPSPVPDLLKRDIWFTLGIAWPFAATLTVRVLINFGFISADAVLMNALWYLVTGGPAVLAVIAYTYYEWFRIERIDVEQERRRNRVLALLTRRLAAADRQPPPETIRAFGRIYRLDGPR